jgi:RNA polymerase sigma-70 factor (ECF subfamily)
VATDVDTAVRERLAVGDGAGAATVAIRALGSDVNKFLHYLLRNEADALDAFSEFAERLWRGLPELRADGSLRAFAFRVASRAAYDVRDNAWRRRGRRLLTREVSILVDEVRSRTFERVERDRVALDQLRDALPLPDQVLLVLRIDQGLSWTEVAEALSAEGEAVTADAALKRFERLKARLQRMAREQGLLE